MSHFSSLSLTNFRCYEAARVDDLLSGFVVLYGANGAGKTNVLEAVSMLSPGRGLRGAKAIEMQRRDAGAPWAVAGELATDYGPVRLGTGIEPQSEKRIVRINGETVRGQNALAEHVACVWLTPQMDRLFLDSAGQRRRFLDRLVFTFDAGHSGRVSRYENAMRQRSKVLQEGGDAAWVDSLEAQMAETGCAIGAARLAFVERLQGACEQFGTLHFPLARMEARGAVEDLLRSGASALEVEDVVKHQLRESRGRDGIVGGAMSGPHKSDLYVVYADKDMEAAQCSTGEQKALLIGIILAHAALIKGERGAAPILLLDEVAAHLDEGRRAALYDLLGGLGGQVWLTGTDRELFAALDPSSPRLRRDKGDAQAQFFEVANSAIRKIVGEL
ncbi:MAG: DNA replication/repair protein RecF [Alphaproteobacteria bacterium]